jgi:hypothetical protein
MSSDVKVTGTLTPVKSVLHETTLEEWATSWVEASGEELIDAYDCHLDQILDDPSYYNLDKINGELYFKSIETDYEPRYEHCNVVVNNDGVIEFEAMYYNGGTGYSELVEDELKKLEQDVEESLYHC